MSAPLCPLTWRPIRPGVAVLAVLVILAACARVPELDARLSRETHGAPYPDLLPLDTALVPLPAPVEEAERLQAALAGRRDSLKARARALRDPVIDERERARMRAGVAR
ncbi:MAG: hypothetical protein ACK5MY_12895 [Jhaorihella sp.]